jgi:NAD(P)-dependent dehydrogenase (short-subunit alcohol dehydrogenase family)
MVDGKVGIITGATSGIGARTAELFVAEGAKVVFTGRRRAEGAALVAQRGAAARFVVADATSEADWGRVVSETTKAFGTRLDFPFNNAGGPAPTGCITSIPVAGLEEAMALLIGSVMLGMKHAAPLMINDNGAIDGHLAGYSSSMVHGAAKAGVGHLTRCVAMEPGESRIALGK